MIKTLFSVLALFITFTAVTTIVMHDFSPRHTLFLLADAILLTAGAKLLQETKSYYKTVAAAMAVLCSVFVIRYVTPTALKVWDVDIYISASVLDWSISCYLFPPFCRGRFYTNCFLA